MLIKEIETVLKSWKVGEKLLHENVNLNTINQFITLSSVKYIQARLEQKEIKLD